jgi:hypothetical protein
MKRYPVLVVLVSVMFVGWNLVAQSQEPTQETKPIQLIQGLDGGDYEPYAPRVIERVQEALRSQGLYSGEVNGLLDQATMEALGEFQKQHSLQVCGVPTPSTRRVLFQSSPTPPAGQP